MGWLGVVKRQCLNHAICTEPSTPLVRNACSVNPKFAIRSCRALILKKTVWILCTDVKNCLRKKQKPEKEKPKGNQWIISFRKIYHAQWKIIRKNGIFYEIKNILKHKHKFCYNRVHYNQFNKERKINAYLKKLKALGWEAPGAMAGQSVWA